MTNEETPPVNPDVLIGSQLAHGLELTQINKFHTKGGTGFAAEDANAFNDLISGRIVEPVGRGNTLNGADRIVDGAGIQTKYYESARATLNSAFGSDGMYRYSGQKLEVPADQYEACLAQMREKIVAGKVPGVSDPDKAADILKQGSVTYKQARNIARAGTVDGLVYDAKTQAVTGAFAFGLSFTIHFATCKWNGQDTKEALYDASLAALGTGAITISSGILTSQILRTKLAAIGTVFARDLVRNLSSGEFGRAVVTRIAHASLGKAVYGGAAINHVAKLARSNVVTSVVVTAVMTTPDAYRAIFAGSISWTQFSKNLAVNASGVAGGAGGWFAGAATGATLGSAVPGIGTAAGGIVGGIIGALGGGSLISWGTKKALDQFVDDDAKAMLDLVKERVPGIAFEFMLNDAECKALVDALSKRIGKGFLRDVYAAKDRPGFVDGVLEAECQTIAAARPKVQAPTLDQVESAVIEIIEEAIDAEAPPVADDVRGGVERHLI